MAEFKSKLVKQVPVTPFRQQAIRTGVAGVAVMLAAIPLSVFPATRDMPAYTFGMGAILVLGAVIAVKGNFGGGADLVDEDILFTPDKIQVGQQSFPVPAVDDLRIVAHSYKKMKLPDGATNSRKDNISNGMSNQVLFDYKGEKHNYHFYVNSAKHMFILGELLTEWYKKKYFFVEYDAEGNRTYLFKERTGAELNEFKKKYGL